MMGVRHLCYLHLSYAVLIFSKVPIDI